jgi:hypothetical protein
MLHDVSKSDTMRIKNVRPNAVDSVPVRMAHGTTQISLSGETDILGQGVALGNGKIEVKQAGNTIFRAGFNDTDGSNKAEAAKPGDSL